MSALDQLDARVEKFRKDALGLQEKRDFLLLSIDLIKSNELIQDMNECEYDLLEVFLYVGVVLPVKTFCVVFFRASFLEIAVDFYFE